MKEAELDGKLGSGHTKEMATEPSLGELGEDYRVLTEKEIMADFEEIKKKRKGQNLADIDTENLQEEQVKLSEEEGLS